MILNDLQFIPGSMKKRKRVSRGNSGKATGRGLKGQKARSGVSLGNFQGGQTPLERRVPKHRSFDCKKKIFELSLSKINRLFDSGVINSDTIIDRDLLKKLKLVKGSLPYKLIGFTDKKIKIEAVAFSKGAKDSVLAVGGSAVSLVERMSS